ncbi:MAG: DUF1440 domain-containing protein [Flavobacteriales bacterium]|nr:DUF1440 domain-containing protein [Flavobacteriales bacterium]
MKSKLINAAIAGSVATAVMSVIMFVGPMMGMPKMNPAEMLSGMMGVPVAVGWAMHFMIGVVFAAAYVLVFQAKVPIGNKPLKGAVFGLVVFIFAQIMMGIMGALMGGMPQPEGSMVLMMVGSIMGHAVYGIVVALLAKD